MPEPDSRSKELLSGQLDSCFTMHLQSSTCHLYLRTYVLEFSTDANGFWARFTLIHIKIRGTRKRMVNAGLCLMFGKIPISPAFGLNGSAPIAAFSLKNF